MKADQDIFDLMFWATIVSLLILHPSPAAAATWPEISFEQVVNGIEDPTFVTAPPDGSDRLFIVEQAGRILIVKGGILLETPFLDITDRVLSGWERGLLSVAFPLDYINKGYFYVDYTASSEPLGHTVVARYFISGNPDVADPNSEEVILTVEQPFSDHNGGQLVFGPDDGFLYISMGDGGSGGDPLGNAQNLGTILGKILRIDVESGVSPYGIPLDNPFAGVDGARGEIWFYGLRNPWRCSFDSDTGDIYIGDVGQNRYEEIDLREKSAGGGANFGWPVLEGDHCYPSPPCTAPDNYVSPIFEYDNPDLGCSVTGGYVYRGKKFPNMQHIYFLGDFCSGRIWGLRREGGTWQHELLADTDYLITTFGEDEQGNLYLADKKVGIISRIMSTDAVPVPDIRINNLHGPVSVSRGEPVEVAVSLDPGDEAGRLADWWVAAATPSGVLWYNGMNWSEGRKAAFRGALFNLDSRRVARAPRLPAGSYRAFFGVDLTVDGKVNQPLYYDGVILSVE